MRFTIPSHFGCLSVLPVTHQHIRTENLARTKIDKFLRCRHLNRVDVALSMLVLSGCFSNSCAVANDCDLRSTVPEVTGSGT